MSLFGVVGLFPPITLFFYYLQGGENLLTRLIIALVWLTVLTVWLVVRQERKEKQMIAEIEADIFGDK